MSVLVSEARALNEARAQLVDRLRVRAPEIEEAVLAHQSSVVPEKRTHADMQFAEEAPTLVGACLDCSRMAIEAGGQWSGPVPPVVVVHARRAVRCGIPLDLHLRGYIAGYEVAWDFVMREVGDIGVAQPLMLQLLREASAAHASLLTSLVAEVCRAYSEELHRSTRTSAERRAALVGKLLGGDPVTARELSAFDYDFEAEHLGVIAIGAGAAPAMEVVAERLGCRLLSVAHDDDVWAWLGASSKLQSAEREIDRMLPNGRYGAVSVSIGRVASEVRGFRLTHRLAQAALLVAKYKPKRTTRYADVALEAHALQDRLLATSLLGTYLSPLQSDRYGKTLIATLRGFYASRRNMATAAVRLGVGRHTVERRLHRIETVVGCELETCHAEMEVALKLAELRELATDRAKLATDNGKTSSSGARSR